MNEVKKLRDDVGNWWRGLENVERVLINYFRDLFSSSNLTGADNIWEVVQGKLSEDHVAWCDKEYTGDEVKEAIQ